MEPIDKEIWRPIKDFDNYEVSDLGNIRHRRLGPLRLSTHRSGGQHVRLCDGSHHRRDCLVHRLVAQAFVPQPEGKHCVTHLNGDRRDNRASNLKWTTMGELNEKNLERRWRKWREKRADTLSDTSSPDPTDC
jgi:hypothetical protein